MQQVNDLLDFEVDTPSDEELRETFAEEIAQLEQLNTRLKNKKYAKSQWQHNKKQHNRKANKAARKARRRTA